MSKSGCVTYNKFQFYTCVHFMNISCPIYGKAHGIMQIGQNGITLIYMWGQPNGLACRNCAMDHYLRAQDSGFCELWMEDMYSMVLVENFI